MEQLTRPDSAAVVRMAALADWLVNGSGFGYGLRAINSTLFDAPFAWAAAAANPAAASGAFEPISAYLLGATAFGHIPVLGDTFLNTIAAAGGLGFSNLKWKKPVMVGDTIFPTARIASLRRSAHHPDRGIRSLDLVVKNQRGEEVMTMTLANLVETREVRP